MICLCHRLLIVSRWHYPLVVLLNCPLVLDHGRTMSPDCRLLSASLNYSPPIISRYQFPLVLVFRCMIQCHSPLVCFSLSSQGHLMTVSHFHSLLLTPPFQNILMLCCGHLLPEGAVSIHSLLSLISHSHCTLVLVPPYQLMILIPSLHHDVEPGCLYHYYLL